MKYDNLSKDELLSKIEKLEHEFTTTNSILNKLKESEEQNQFQSALLNAVEQAIIVTKPDGEIIYWNPFAEQIYGWGTEKVIGRNIMDITVPQVSKIQGTEIMAQLSAGKSWSGEFLVQHRNGTIFPIFITDTPIINENGELTSIIGTSIDITERKRAVEKIKVKEKRFRAVFDANPFPIAVVDENDQNIAYWSKSAQELFGHTPKTSDEWYKLAYPDPEYRQDVINRWKPLLETAQKSKVTINTGVHQIACKDGSVKICQIYAQFIPDYLIVTLNDITDNKKVDEELRYSENKYRNLVEMASDAIYLVSEDFIILDTNQGALDMLGKDRDEIVGHSIGSVDPNHTIDEQVELWKVVPFNQQIIIESTHLHKNGDLIPVEINGKKYIDNGRTYYYSITRDITERKLSEEQFEQQSLDLRFLNSMAITLVDKPDDSGFSKTLLKGVQNHTNAVAAVFSLYDSEKKALITKHFEVKSSVMQKAIKIAGEKILNIASPIDDEAYASIIKSKIGICDNFVDVTFGAIPKIVDKAMRVATGINRIYAIGHYIDGQLYGSSTLSFKKDQAKPSMEMLESFAQLMAVYIRNSSATRALKESEHRFRFLAENAKDIIYRMSIPDAVYEYVSPAAIEIYGYTPEEFYETPLLIAKIIHPEWAEYLKSEWHNMKDGNVQPFYEYQIINKSGEIKWLNQRNTLIKNVEGKTVAIEAVVTDVTSRKQMEEVLMSNQNRYKKAQAMGHVGNWEYDPISTKFWASDEAKKIYGFELDSKDFTSEKVESCIPERERVHKALIDLIEHDQEYDLVFDIITNVNGTRKTIHSIAELGKDEKGNILKVTGVISDITKRKLVEEELILAKEKAEESDRLKSAFLANMSHEIRTPMNGILGFASLLKEPDLTGEEQHKFIEVIERSGDRMLTTINDIIDISKIEAGQVDTIISEINLNEQLDELFEFFLPETKKKKIKLSITSRVSDQYTHLKSDKEKLESILTNFIKNAIKYTHSGSIEFGYSIIERDEQNELKFYVKDTGIGIQKEKLKAVFSRFMQADIEDKQVYEGSGLGLAISKAYVEILGGKIWVESEEGLGSQFFFTIPFPAINKEVL